MEEKKRKKILKILGTNLLIENADLEREVEELNILVNNLLSVIFSFRDLKTIKDIQLLNKGKNEENN
jgi:hypothetical protein